MNQKIKTQQQIKLKLITSEVRRKKKSNSKTKQKNMQKFAITHLVKGLNENV